MDLNEIPRKCWQWAKELVGLWSLFFQRHVKEKAHEQRTCTQGTNHPSSHNPPAWETYPQVSATASHFVVDKFHCETIHGRHKFLLSETRSPQFGSKPQILSILRDRVVPHEFCYRHTPVCRLSLAEKHRLTSEMLAFCICSILIVLLMASSFSC